MTNASEWKNYLADLKPSVTADEALDCYRRNMETGIALFKTYTEGVYAIARRHGDFLLSNAAEGFKASKKMLEGLREGNPAIKENAILTNAIERGMHHMREVAEIGSKSAQEIFTLAGRRLTQQLDQFHGAKPVSVASSKKAA